MRLALLGANHDTLLIARAVANSDEHALVVACEAGACQSELERVAHGLAWESSWENLLADSQLDAVVLTAGSDKDALAERFKRLAQAGVPLLVVHPACDVMLAYEIEAARQETMGIILPFAPDWSHPALGHLLAWYHADADHTEPNADQLIFERWLADRSSTAVWRQFTRDLRIIRNVLGEITSISGLGANPGDPSAGHLTIHCAGAGGHVARWSVAPIADEHSYVSLSTARGTARLLMSAQEPWRLLLPDATLGTGTETKSLATWDAHAEALTRLADAIQGRACSPSWSEICLDLEIADNAVRSVKRKRAIDLYLGDRSEEKTFKGFMSAAGCLILLAVLAAFVVLAVVEGFRIPFRDAVASTSGASRLPFWLRLWPVYPLLAFLLLQLLVRIARRPAVDVDASSASSKPSHWSGGEKN